MVMPKINKTDIEDYYKILGLDQSDEGLIMR